MATVMFKIAQTNEVFEAANFNDAHYEADYACQTIMAQGRSCDLFQWNNEEGDWHLFREYKPLFGIAAV